MQPTLPEPAQPTPPQPNPQPPPIYLQRPPQSTRPNRPSTSCDRHPQEHFSGFCPSCLRERLAILDSNNAPLSSISSSSSTTRNPTIFFSVAPSLNASLSFRSFVSSSRSNRLSPSSFFSVFRRTMSLSDSGKERFFSVFKRKRKSCDNVRVRSTLFSLFSKEDECKAQNLDSSSIIQRPMNEDDHEERESIVLPVEIESGDEIRVADEPSNVTVTGGNVARRRPTEIMEEEELENEVTTVGGDKKERIFKTTEEHINPPDSNAKKSFRRNFKDITRGFSTVTSIFNKKLQKWRQNKNTTK